MQNVPLTSMAHELWRQVIRPGDLVVDATCGNGHDAVCLARAVGPSGTLHALDVQPSAVAATRAAVDATLPPEFRPQTFVVQECHSRLQEIVGSNVARLVCFNLGYLPGGDKATTTSRATTLAAVEAAVEVLLPGGLLSMLCYTGHPGGQEEYEGVRAAVEALPPAYWVTSELRLLNRPTAPVLLLAWKRELGGQRRA